MMNPMSLYSARRAGIGRQRSREGGRQQFIPGLRLKKELFVRRQSRGVRQQHAQRHLASPRVAPGKFRHDAGHRRFQIEQSALVENHRHGGGRDHFRNRSQIEDRGHGHGRRVRLVSESTKGLQRDQFSLIGNRNRSCRKRRPANSFLQDVEGAAKDRILPLVCGSREAGRGLRSGTRRGRTLRQRCDVLDIRVITKFRGWVKLPAAATESGLFRSNGSKVIVVG